MFSIGIIQHQNPTVYRLIDDLQRLKQGSRFGIECISVVDPKVFTESKPQANEHQHAVYFVDNAIGQELYARFRTIVNVYSPAKVILTVSDPESLSTFLGLELCPNAVLYEPIISRDLESVLFQVQRDVQRISGSSHQKSFRLKSDGTYLVIPLADILFFESRGKHVALKTHGKEYLFYSSFDEVIQQLDPRFFRCHKGYLINRDQLAQADFRSMLATMRDHSKIPISRSRKDELKEFLKGYGHDQ